MNINGQIKSFQYLGGKYSVLPWLLPLLPVTRSFVDVFGGSMAVTLNRPQSMIETYNDIDRNVVNFFKVLRSQPEALITALELTPHSRQEYLDAIITPDDSDLEKARKFFIRTVQSQFSAGNMENKKGWRAALRESRTKISEATNKYLNSVAGLSGLIDRLRQIQIENRDFRWVIEKYDTSETLFYCDSPYYTTHRSSTKYQHEMTEQDFLDLAELSKTVQGKIAISGYQCEFIDRCFSHLQKHIGPKRKNGISKKDIRECLWTNYDPINNLPNLFQ